MDPTFLIKLIVEAQNRVGTTLDKAAQSVDKLTKAQDKQTASEARAVKAQDDQKKSIKDLQTAYAAFTSEIEKGNKSTDDATFGLKRFSQEFDKLSRRAPAGSDLAEQLNQASIASKKLMDQLADAEKERQRQVEAAYQQAAQVEKAYEDLDRKRVASEREATQNREKLLNDLLDVARSTENDRDNLTDDGAKKRVASAEAEAQSQRKITQKANDDFSTEMSAFFAKREAAVKAASDFEIKEAARVESLRATSRAGRDTLGLRSIGDDAESADGKVKGLLSSFHDLFSVDSARMDRIRTAIDDVDDSLGKGSFSAIRFAGNLRSLVYVGAFVFFQELTGAAVALGGALVAVASSAVQAGAALVGSLAAGAAQALPVIGLLGAAWGRVGAVFKAVQQNFKDQAQAAYDSAQAADRVRSATDGIRSAQEALANAQRSATSAQTALTAARADAVRQIQDLVEAERKAQLQAESAALAQRGAQTAFSSALSGGDVGDLAQKQLDVQNANLGVSDASTALARARTDAATATAAGVSGFPSVVAASQAVQDAQRGITDATRGLKEARTNAAEVTHQISTADRTLAQMLAQLSPAEQRLYDALNRLYTRYLQVFVGDKKHTGILGGIIDAFTEGVDRANTLLGDGRLIATAKRLADGIGAQLKRAFDFVTDGRNVGFIERMADQARQNLPTVVTILEHIAGFVRNIADAGQGAFKKFLSFIEDLASQADNATGSSSGLSKLEAFFDKGEEYAESFTKLGIAIGGLFLAIIGDSAQQGQGAIESITANVQEATKWIDDHQADVQKFFSQAIAASGAIASAVGTLARDLFSLFQQKSVESFAHTFQDTLLPALLVALKTVGAITQVFFDLAGTKPGSAFFQFLISFALISKALGAIGGFLLRFGRSIAELFGREGLVEVFNILLRLLGPTRLVIAAIVSFIALANGKLPTMHSLLKLVAGLLGAILLQIYGQKALIAGLDLVRLGLARLGESAVLSKLAPLGKFFTDALTNVGSLIKRLPILRGLFKETAESNVLSEGLSLPSTGGRPGVILPPGTRSVPIEKEAGGAFVKGAGGAEIAAGTGAKVGAFSAADLAVPVAVFVGLLDYITANGGVLQKLQKVASDFTFGLIPSPTDRAAQAGNSAFAQASSGLGANVLKTINTPRSTSSVNFGSGTVLPVTSGGITTADINRDFGSVLKNYGKNLAPGSVGANAAVDLATALHLTQGEFDALSKQQLTNLSTQFDKLRPHIDNIKSQLKGFAKQLAGIDINSIVSPKDIAEFEDNLHRMKTAGVTSLTDLQTNVQFNIDEITKGFKEGSFDWTQAMAKNFDDSVAVVKKAMKEHVIASKDGLAEIRKLFREEFGLYGFTDSEADNIMKGQSYTGGPEEGSAGPTGSGAVSRVTKAVGGWIGNKGERGADKVGAWLGRGEAVLNWAHQKVVEPAMQAMYGTGLDGMFKSVRGEHAGGGMNGYAAGGFVAEPGTNFSYGQEPSIVSALRKLATLMRTTIYGISGYRTPQHSVEVGGFADDPHTRGQAADIGVGSPSLASAARLTAALLKKVGLYRPFYPAQPHEINHVQLLAGAVQAAVKSASSSTAATIRRVLLSTADGRGALGALSQRGLDRVRQAASDQLQAYVSSAGGDGGGGVAGIGLGGGKAQGAGADVVAAFKRAIRSLHPSKLIQLALWEAGIVESGLHNLPYGDKDSLGSLQERTSIYGRDQALDPFASAVRFIKQALAKLPWGGSAGELAQAVQVSKYPGRYDAAAGQARQYLARGGEVAGRMAGQAVPIVAHAGEWVVNKVQQSKLAGMAGTSIDALRSMLGFTGGKGTYAGGGAVQPYSSPAFIGSSPGDVTKQITAANKIIAQLRTSVVNSKFTDALSQTFASLLGDGGLFDQLSTAVDGLTNKLATNLARATFKLDKAGDVVERLDTVGVADRTIANLQDVYKALNGEQEKIQGELADVAKRLKAGGLSKGEENYLKSVQKNLSDRLTTVRQSVADNLSSTFQAVEDRVTALTDKAQTQETGSSFLSGIQTRLRSIFGATGAAAIGLPSPTQLADVQSAALTAQADAVQKAADYAKKHGHDDTYNTLIQSVGDLRTQALEVAQQGITDAASDINDLASRKQAGIDISNRAADLLEKGGNIAGAYALRGQNLVATGANLTSQRDSLIGLRNQALAESGGKETSAIDALTDQIGDLDESIDENTQAEQENTIAARSAAIDAITARGGFFSSFFSGLGSILTGLGQLTGVTDTAGQRTLLTGEATNLNQTGSGLADQLLHYGIDIRGQSPTQIAATLSANAGNISSIDAGLSPSDRTVFENLVGAVISNTGAQVDNSNALAALDGSMSQAFSSTAWQRFRTAVFNGAGGLLPNYQFTVPSAASGALITQGGLLNVHTGERVVKAASVVRDGGGNTVYEGDTILNVTSPTEVLDPNDVGRQLAFVRKTKGR